MAEQTVGVAARSQRADQEPTSRQYLFGVQGLRTVAALMVAVYHVWFHRVSGGVDVFFVVAGFFAAGSLAPMATLSAGSRWRQLRDYILRMARRVIPSAAVVIVATVVASLWWMPATLWPTNIRHALASALFVENFYLIHISTDYLEQGADSSPFQQFWALSVQVQSYVFFAVLVFLIASLVIRFGGGEKGARKGITLAALATFLASFAYSIYLTYSDQTIAYFAFSTRVWEFLAGVLLALILPRLVIPQWVAAVSGWAGLVAILAFGAFFDLSTTLPGYMSLVPVAAAAGVIVASRASVEPIFLIAKPMLWFADSSFAFYLWHWPLLVFYRWQINEDVSLLGGLAILTLAAGLALLTTRLVETPFRRWALLSRYPILSTILSLALLLPAFTLTAHWDRTSKDLIDKDLHELKQYVDADAEPPRGALLPSLRSAKADRPSVYGHGCHQNGKDSEVLECVWSRDKSRSRTIVVAGGSHEAQWIETAIDVADESGVTVIGYTKSGCPFGDNASAPESVDPSCEEWSELVLERILEDPPDVVVAMATRIEEDIETIPEWKRSYFEQLNNAGISVVAIRDNPRFDQDIPQCIELNGTENCEIASADFFTPTEDLEVPEDDNFIFVDLANSYCPGGTCTVIQDWPNAQDDAQVLVYRDDNHLTRTWVTQHNKPVKDAISRALSTNP